jgi:17beta-estradiol 17-dehydrogenase / very-long-chain 3-oxoacyl-CoA reductase
VVDPGLAGIDFSNFDKAAQDKVAAAIKDLDLGVLINNVGQSYNFPMFFHELTEEQVSRSQTKPAD